MRIALITLQLCVLGTLFVLIAVPLLAALGGLVYAMISAFEYVQAAVIMGLGEAFLFYSMQSMGMLPLAASPPAFLVAASSFAAAVIAGFTICIPLLISLAINLVLGFLAYYRNCYRRARFWAIVCNCVALACYVLPQLIFKVPGFKPPPLGGIASAGGCG